MRRVFLALSGLAAGTTLLISLKSAPGASRLPGQVAADNAAIAALASTSATPSPGGSPGPTPVPGTTPASGATGGPARSTAPPKAPTTTTKPPGGTPTAPTNPGGPAIIVGDAAVTEFGFVTVGITVANGRITDVIAQELPGDEPRSISISTKAGPILRQRALAAQSATFDSVSGATWTSDAYKQSLRSAMTKAGL